MSISRAQLIESHLPLVRTVARRFLGHGEELEDLVQVGAVGLVKAADRFDADRGVRFGTFANAVIEGEIRRHLRDRTGTLRIPRNVQRTGAEARRCREQLGRTLGRPPTTREIAAALSVDEHKVEQALAAEGARNPVPISPDEGKRLRGAESEASPPGSDDKLLLASSAHVLDDRERRIVLLRFHADMTEREIARKVGISQAQVSRLLDGALKKLRQELRGSKSPAEPCDTAFDVVISPPVTPKISGVVAPEESSKLAHQHETSKYRASSGYSGRFLVRMPSELHEQLARAAERDQISLNRYVTEALAASVADVPDRAPADDDRPTETVTGAAAQPRALRSLRVALATNLVVVVLAGLAAVVLVALALQRGI
ncbi:MAG: sigma-70 family RNA polymerase sigma factor [Solirubrobacteraceae bacterium]